MTMVPAPKLSKPHLIFYGGCGASPEVMSRFGDGCGSGGGCYNNINGNHHYDDDATTTADNIITNKVDKSNSSNNNNNNNKVISSVLGSDLGIGHHPHHHNNNNINIVMADEQQQQQQQHSRNSNNSVNNNDDGSGGVIRQRSYSVAKTREDDDDDDDDVMESRSWLQLGLGGGSGTHLGNRSPHQVESTAPRTSSGGLMLELNLGGGFHHHHHRHNHNQTTPFQMPGIDSRVPQTPPHGSLGGGGSVSGPTTFVSPRHQILISSLSPQSQLYLLHQQQQLQLQQQQQLGWGLMNQRTTMSASMSPSSSSSLPPQQQVLLPAAQGGVPPFFTRPSFTPSGGSVDAPDSEFRLIHPPPRRPHSGIWFSLHASLHQSKEPFLPQVSKNFLRIKDGRMTVRLVMKYLANKLGLDNESEVEIRCRGQQLVPFLTLQHVRDNIWSPREAAVTLLPDSSTSDHLMVLNYGRSTTSSAYNYLT